MLRRRKLRSTSLALMSLLILGTGCLPRPESAAAEVQRRDGRIVMEEADYRFFITKIETLTTENKALKRVLSNERASFDVYVSNVQAERKARVELDRLHAEKIAILQKQVEKLKRRQYWPGVIIGGGYGTDGDGVQGVIGLGWKVGL